jgi:hypothetical protein
MEGCTFDHPMSGHLLSFTHHWYQRQVSHRLHAEPCMSHLCWAKGGAHQLGQVTLVAWQQVELAAVGVELLKHALVVLWVCERVSRMGQGDSEQAEEGGWGGALYNKCAWAGCE